MMKITDFILHFGGKITRTFEESGSIELLVMQTPLATL